MSFSKVSSGLDVDWFLEQPEFDLLCGICLDVLIEPRSCKNGHLFCSACLNAHLEHSNFCPFCRAFIIQRHLKKAEQHIKVIDKIQNLVVKCVCNESFFRSSECFTWGMKQLKECGPSYTGGKHFVKKRVLKGKSFRSLCMKKKKKTVRFALRSFEMMVSFKCF